MKSAVLLAVFAHPDDEAFGVGGTLAKYAAAGCDVYLVTATRGEAGQIALPELATPASLPAVREQELRCACQIYGIHPPIFLDYLDGQLTIVNQGQAVGKLVRLIRQLKPQVLITFGPDGIYGHYDHLAVHRWAAAAVELAVDPDCFPDRDACETYQVSKLYYRVMAEEALATRRNSGQRPAVMMDGVPFPFVGRPLKEITTVIDVSEFVGVKRQGILCHATQVGPDSRYAQAPDEIMNDPWFRQETFLLAQSTVGWPEHPETDLLVGLAASSG
jgi:LmbE family N-acetylglucosaminyl deacetylase